MKMKIFLLSICIFSLKIFTSCFTTENVTSSVKSRGRELILDGNIYSPEKIESLGGITSWYCTDKYNYFSSTVLLEIGYFTKMQNWGFILYDGTNEGTQFNVHHNRDGLNHRWDWGKKGDGGSAYSFIIEPDGTGLYYHFLEGESTAKPSSIYNAHKRR